MRIVLRFDDQMLDSSVKRTSPLIFTISWEHEGTYYPMKNWSDFGVVILDWWIAATIRLLQGSRTEKFEFMDGPYSINAIYHRQSRMVELLPDTSQASWITSSKWNVSSNELVEELLRAANTVRTKLMQGEYGEKEQALLETDIVNLRTTWLRGRS